MIKKIISAHRFFMTEGIEFVTEWEDDFDEWTGSMFRKKTISKKNKKYLPIAYLKFMYYTIFNK